MDRKPGMHPHTVALTVAIGLVEVAIVALWLVSDAEVATFLNWLTR